MERQVRQFHTLFRCKNHFLSVYDTWALSKVPSGVLHGAKRSLGLFTECITFRHQTNSSIIGNFRGKYCLVSYTPLKSANEGSIDRELDWLEG